MQRVLFNVGGITVTGTQAAEALHVLRKSRGMMVRQPLTRAMHPLSRCDYHRVAGPYKERVCLPKAGRGAAGRHLTKTAFCLALEDIIAQAAQGAQFSDLLAEAALAFATDHSYGVAMAKAAVLALEQRHRSDLRASLTEASRAAVAQCAARDGKFSCSWQGACGTGECRFARGIFRSITGTSESGRTPRPANHEGSAFDLTAGMAELARLRPLDLAA